jgi:hypothetical protein
MQRMTYRVIPQKGDRYSVEMTSPSGKRSLIPDFRDHAEADAWIVQTMRMLHADPREKEPTAKPAARDGLLPLRRSRLCHPEATARQS